MHPKTRLVLQAENRLECPLMREKELGLDCREARHNLGAGFAEELTSLARF